MLRHFFVDRCEGQMFHVHAQAKPGKSARLPAEEGYRSPFCWKCVEAAGNLRCWLSSFDFIALSVTD
jgi:hypothetical protein